MCVIPLSDSIRKNEERRLQTIPCPDPMDNVYGSLSQRFSPEEEMPPLKIQVPATLGIGDLQECQGQICKCKEDTHIGQ